MSIDMAAIAHVQDDVHLDGDVGLQSNQADHVPPIQNNTDEISFDDNEGMLAGDQDEGFQHYGDGDGEGEGDDAAHEEVYEAEEVHLLDLSGVADDEDDLDGTAMYKVTEDTNNDAPELDKAYVAGGMKDPSDADQQESGFGLTPTPHHGQIDDAASEIDYDHNDQNVTDGAEEPLADLLVASADAEAADETTQDENSAEHDQDTGDKLNEEQGLEPDLGEGSNEGDVGASEDQEGAYDVPQDQGNDLTIEATDARGDGTEVPEHNGSALASEYLEESTAEHQQEPYAASDVHDEDHEYGDEVEVEAEDEGEVDYMEVVPVESSFDDGLDCPNVHVRYRATTYSLFKSADMDMDYLFSDTERLQYPLSQFLDSLREEISTTLAPNEEIVIRVEGLGLEFAETTDRTILDRATFGSIVELYDQLVKSDNPDTHNHILQVFLVTRPNVSRRLQSLFNCARDGDGLEAHRVSYPEHLTRDFAPAPGKKFAASLAEEEQADDLDQHSISDLIEDEDRFQDEEAAEEETSEWHVLNIDDEQNLDGADDQVIDETHDAQDYSEQDTHAAEAMEAENDIENLADFPGEEEANDEDGEAQSSHFQVDDDPANHAVDAHNFDAHDDNGDHYEETGGGDHRPEPELGNEHDYADEAEPSAIDEAEPSVAEYVQIWPETFGDSGETALAEGEDGDSATLPAQVSTDGNYAPLFSGSVLLTASDVRPTRGGVSLLPEAVCLTSPLPATYTGFSGWEFAEPSNGFRCAFSDPLPVTDDDGSEFSFDLDTSTWISANPHLDEDHNDASSHASNVIIDGQGARDHSVTENGLSHQGPEYTLEHLENELSDNVREAPSEHTSASGTLDGDEIDISDALFTGTYVKPNSEAFEITADPEYAEQSGADEIDWEDNDDDIKAPEAQVSSPISNIGKRLREVDENDEAVQGHDVKRQRA